MAENRGHRGWKRRDLDPLNSIARQHPGFTLVEAMMALAIIALILVGMQSAMMLTARAMPDARTVPSEKLAASAALDQLAADLAYATSITRAIATELAFVVPDRDGDSLPDTIRYTFSTDGSLTRQFNAAAPATLGRGWAGTEFAFDTTTQSVSASDVQGPEMLLCSYDTAAVPKNSSVDNNHWIGIVFRPTLASSATSWSITRVKVKARVRNSALGETYIQIRPAIGSLPGSDVMAQSSMLEKNLLADYAWQEFIVANVAGLTPGNAMALVLQWASDNESCEVAYVDNGAAAGCNLVTTTNAGSSWSADSSRALLFYVYGRVQSAGTPAQQTAIRSIRCTIRPDSQTRVESTIQVLNEPTMP